MDAFVTQPNIPAPLHMEPDGQPLPPLTPIIAVPDDEAIRIIMTSVRKLYGDAINAMQFHAWDTSGKPTGPAMSATAYAEWLLDSNQQRPLVELRQLASQYDTAYKQHHEAMDASGNPVAKEQVAEFLIAAEVLRYAAATQASAGTTDFIAPRPAPAVSKLAVPTPADLTSAVAQALPLQSIKPHPSIPTLRPVPLRQESVLQPLQSVPMESAAAQAGPLQGIESPEELKRLQADLTRALGISEAETTPEHIDAAEKKVLTAERQRLAAEGISGEQLENALQDSTRAVHLQALQLRSIGARLDQSL